MFSLSMLKANTDVFIAVGIIGILLVMILPLPAPVLDMLLAMNLALSLVTLLVALYTLEPLEFAIFPSLLLFLTLFRLALNISSTRLILLHGNQGPDAAGAVIKAFGNFVIGGNFVVGVIVFSILIVINLVVITRGAGRIAEVAARFTLDAMPGKQMAIDADLNAGLINEQQARRRRLAIQQEADFYGAMDGASKFVRGDAIAGILITFVNSIGGIIIGVLQQGMQEEQQAATPEPVSDPMDALTPIDLLELEVGYGLITLVDSERDGELLERIKTVRLQIAQDLGVVVPPLRIRDNLELKPGEYTMLIKGVEVVRGELMLGHYLAMHPGEEPQAGLGIPTTEPAFGLPAVWVSADTKDQAQLAGYTVVDLPTVIITHLTEVIKRHLHELLSREEVQKLLKRFAETSPKVVEELVPTLLSLGGVQKVLQNLLWEQISIRDLLSILETLADYAPITRDPVMLTEYVRQSLARSITKQWQTAEGDIPALMLSYELEDTLTKAIQHPEHGSYLAIDPKLAQRLITELTRAVETMMQQQQAPLLVTSPLTRPHVKRLTEPYVPQLVVLSHNDIVANVRIRNLGVVKV